jgi:hypothetical protein
VQLAAICAWSHWFKKTIFEVPKKSASQNIFFGDGLAPSASPYKYFSYILR